MVMDPKPMEESVKSDQDYSSNAPFEGESIQLGFPSATTIVFILILVTSLVILMPYSTATSVAWYLVLAIIAIPISLHIIEPHRLIHKYQMQPVDEIAPEILPKVEEFATRMGMAAPPIVLVTKARGVPVQTFSSFTQQYIVLNEAELKKAEQAEAKPGKPNPLDPILIHELAHLSNGDTWKLQLSRKIILAIFLYSLIMFLSSFANRYAIQRALLGSPIEKSAQIIDVFSFVALMLVEVYLLKVMGQVREFHADDRAKNVFSKEDVAQSLVWSSQIWSGQAEAQIPARGFFRGLRSIGLAFLSDIDFQRERLLALASGAQFHTVMRQVLFAAGLAVGITTSYLTTNGVELLSLGFIFGGSAIGIVYLFPYILKQPKLVSIIREAFIASFYFGLGVIALLGAQIVVDITISSIFEAPLAVVGRYDLGLLAIMGLIVQCSLILALALGFMISTYSGWNRLIGFSRPDKPGRLLFLLMFVQTISAYVIMDTIIKFVQSSIFYPSQKAEAVGLSLVAAVVFCIIPILLMQRRVSEH
jgi:Zn-dependent protease with chaperone function